MDFYTIDVSEFPYDQLQLFAGYRDENLETLSKALHTEVLMRNNEIKIQMKEGLSLEKLGKLFQNIFDAIDARGKFEKSDLLYMISLYNKDMQDSFKTSSLEPVVKTKSGKLIYPKTANQAMLVDTFKNNDLTFASGIAGTGKTYLAVAYAVALFKGEKVKKIILTRPAVEAGESLGFLPGDMKEKVDPYLRPLYDALHEMLGQETTERLIEKEVIEIAPLAFMRGRTLNDAIVILDEAQNTTRAQMKMFLTRMGRNTKMIVTGDVTQTDLVKKKDSGLLQATKILQNLEGVGMIELGSEDVVRNPLVSRILNRYAAAEEKAEAARARKDESKPL